MFISNIPFPALSNINRALAFATDHTVTVTETVTACAESCFFTLAVCTPTSTAVSSEAPEKTSSHSVSSYSFIWSESPEATSSCGAYNCSPPAYSDKTVTETKHHPKTTTYTVTHTSKPATSSATDTVSYESSALPTWLSSSSSGMHSPCGPSTKQPTYTFPNGSHPTSEPWYSGKPTGSMILTTSGAVHTNSTSSNSFSIVITTGKVSPTGVSSESQRPSSSTEDEDDAPESTSSTEDKSPTETEPPSSSTTDDESSEETESALPTSTDDDDVSFTWRTSTLPNSSATATSGSKDSATQTTMVTSYKEPSASSTAQGPPEYSDPPSYSYKGRRRM